MKTARSKVKPMMLLKVLSTNQTNIDTSDYFEKKYIIFNYNEQYSHERCILSDKNFPFQG